MYIAYVSVHNANEVFIMTEEDEAKFLLEYRNFTVIDRNFEYEYDRYEVDGPAVHITTGLKVENYKSYR
jgi:hypothetical protein